MDEETWFTADEALEAGFINFIEQPIALAAKFDIKKLNYKNTSLVVDMFNQNKKSFKMENQIEELKNFISDLFNKKNKVEKEVVNILENKEVSAKISELEKAINASDDNLTELTDSLGEKESNIVALLDEVEKLESKLAKYEGTSSNVVPEKDPTPAMAENKGNEWDNLVNIFK